MKYYFASEKNNKRHVIIAESKKNAERIAQKNNLDLDCLYELTKDTFQLEGFLMTQK